MPTEVFTIPVGWPLSHLTGMQEITDLGHFPWQVRVLSVRLIHAFSRKGDVSGAQRYLEYLLQEPENLQACKRFAGLVVRVSGT